MASMMAVNSVAGTPPTASRDEAVEWACDELNTLGLTMYLDHATAANQSWFFVTFGVIFQVWQLSPSASWPAPQSCSALPLLPSAPAASMCAVSFSALLSTPTPTATAVPPPPRAGVSVELHRRAAGRDCNHDAESTSPPLRWCRRGWGSCSLCCKISLAV